jgi:hypothetical protein
MKQYRATPARGIEFQQLAYMSFLALCIAGFIGAPWWVVLAE